MSNSKCNFLDNTLICQMYCLSFVLLRLFTLKLYLQAFHYTFIKVIFEKNIKADLVDNFIYFRKSKKIPTSLLNNYYYKRLKLALYLFYNQQKIIIVITSILILENDIIFFHEHSNKKEKVQWPLKIGLNILLIALIWYLSINEATKDAI